MFVSIDPIDRWVTRPAWLVEEGGAGEDRGARPEGGRGGIFEGGEGGVKKGARVSERGAGGEGDARRSPKPEDNGDVWAVYVHQVLYGAADRDVAAAYDDGRGDGGDEAVDFGCRVMAEGEELELLPVCVCVCVWVWVWVCAYMASVYPVPGMNASQGERCRVGGVSWMCCGRGRRGCGLGLG